MGNGLAINTQLATLNKSEMQATHLTRELWVWLHVVGFVSHFILSRPNGIFTRGKSVRLDVNELWGDKKGWFVFLSCGMEDTHWGNALIYIPNLITMILYWGRGFIYHQ